MAFYSLWPLLMTQYLLMTIAYTLMSNVLKCDLWTSVGAFPDIHVDIHVHVHVLECLPKFKALIWSSKLTWGYCILEQLYNIHVCSWNLSDCLIWWRLCNYLNFGHRIICVQNKFSQVFRITFPGYMKVEVYIRENWQFSLMWLMKSNYSQKYALNLMPAPLYSCGLHSVAND